MCRAACHGGAGDCGTNLAMVSIIMSQFPRQYEARQKEVRRTQETNAQGMYVTVETDFYASRLSGEECCFSSRGGRGGAARGRSVDMRFTPKTSGFTGCMSRGYWAILPLR